MSELRHWLRLRHSRHIGASAVRRLLSHFGTIDAAMAATVDDWKASGISKPALASLGEGENGDGIEADLRWADEPGRHIIPFATEDYPARLRSISDAPLVLYVHGDPEVLHTPQLAMVGSRNPSRSGCDTARQFAEHTARMGITITSGMALGIDAASHRGALEAGGLTIAVAATGLDRIYPAQHRELAEQIVAEGAIVSEFPIGTTARAEFFPRRNRIISGLSVGTLVVEAAVRSGSLSTAKHAVEQGREVLAIPGSIHNPLARGCHALIKQGAKLVETADDVLEELAPQLGTWQPPKRTQSDDHPLEQSNRPANTPPLDPTYQRVMDCLDYEPQSIDELVECSGHAAAEVASMLLMLELNGHARRSDGNKYSRM